MHTQIDLRGNIPSFIHVSDGKMHEVNVFDLMTPEPGSFTIMDSGFLDFTRLYRLTQAGALRHPTKKQYAFRTCLFPTCRQNDGLALRQGNRRQNCQSPLDFPEPSRPRVFIKSDTEPGCCERHELCCLVPSGQRCVI
jgi:hypothetical protein